MTRFSLIHLLILLAMPAAGLCDCLEQAAKHHQVPVNVLKAIQATEGGQPGLVMTNSNGTSDHGNMQINSVWLPQLAKVGVTQDHLIHDRCVNLYVAAWILSQKIRETGSLAAGISAYHSKTPQLGLRYLLRVLEELERSDAD